MPTVVVEGHRRPYLSIVARPLVYDAQPDNRSAALRGRAALRFNYFNCASRF